MSLLKDNINAVLMLNDFIKKSLGPNGSFKLIIDGAGDEYITKEGGEILSKIKPRNPIIRLLSNASKSMSNLGDGSKRIVLLTAELLRKAEELISNGFHPTTIINGFNKGLRKTIEEINKSSFTTKLITVLNNKDKELAGILSKINPENVKILTRKGNGIELIRGVVINKEKTHPNMPSMVNNAHIFITQDEISINNNTNITINSNINKWINKEKIIIKEKVKKILSTGANVIICQRGINDLAQQLFANEGVLAIRRVREKDIHIISKATNGKIMSINEATSEGLGKGRIFNKWFGSERLTIIDKTPNTFHTIIIKSPIFIPSKERVNSFINLIKTFNKNNKAVIINNELINKLKNNYNNKESIAYNSFINSLNKISGFDLLIIKEQLLKTATEITNSILRINEVIRK